MPEFQDRPRRLFDTHDHYDTDCANMLSSRSQPLALDGPYFPTKTPSRLRTENLIQGAKTVGPKGKNTNLKTPFGPGSARKHLDM